MQLLPNRTISFEQLDYLIANCLFDYGGESLILSPEDKRSLYKVFVRPNSRFPREMSDNKKRKIESIYWRQVEHLVPPMSTLSCNGMLIGYELTVDPDDISLFNLALSRKDKLYYLRELKKILEYFASQDITFGDIKSDNILINPKTRRIRFCDIDNIRVGEHPIDVMSQELYDFTNANNNPDETADSYMHNLLTLEQLYYEGTSQYNILTKLYDGTRPADLPPKAHTVIDHMLKPKEFTKEYMIQYFKR